MVVHLLVLGRVVTHQRAPRQQQVGTGSVQSLVHEEILLLPSEVGSNLLHGGVEIVAHLSSSHVHGMQGAQQRSLVVEGLTAIRNKHGGNHQRIVNDEHRTCWIPSRVATGLEGAADAARGERRGVRLLLDEQLAGELLDHAALAVVLDKRVVLLGSTFGQRLEPVGVVRHTILNGPLLHASGHTIGNCSVQTCAIIHDINHLLVHVLGQILVHLLTIEDLLTKILIRSFTWCFYIERLLLECLTDNLKS